MGMHSKMPNELWQFVQNDGYVFMDHGDIFYGCFVEFNHFPDYVFFTQPSNRKRLLDLHQKGKSATFDEITALSWPIKDFDKIRYYAPKGDLGNYDEGADLSWSRQRDWKKMFVFGAGASAYSVLKSEEKKFRAFEYCPPMGNELFGSKFSSHIKKYKGVQLSQASLASFGNDVEGFFEEEWKELYMNFNPGITARHINIVYYLRELFLKISEETIDKFNYCNLYSVFVRKVQAYLGANKSESAAFVSFNYDTILDSYLEDFFGAPYSSMHDYINYEKSRHLLFKPHGSCNWGWRFTDSFLNANSADIPKFLFDNQTTFAELYYSFLGSPKEMVKQNSWGHEMTANGFTNGRFTINKNKIQLIKSDPKHYFPSLLIPYKDKDDMIMPYDHFDQMTQYINSMEDLYLIGWKGNEANFNGMLKNANRLQNIVIVNPFPDEVKANLANYIDINNPKRYNVTCFKDFETFAETVVL